MTAAQNGLFPVVWRWRRGVGRDVSVVIYILCSGEVYVYDICSSKGKKEKKNRGRR